MLRTKARRIVEAGHRQVHLVAAFAEFEAEGRPALTAIGPLSNRRAVVPIGLMLPVHVRLLHALESNGDRSGRPLAHAAMAQIPIVVMNRGGVAHSSTGAAAIHLLGHSSAPLVARPLRV